MTDLETVLVERRRWREVRGLLASVAFLTRIPVGSIVALDGDDVARAGPGFPLVGAGIGALVGVCAATLARPLSGPLAAAVAVAVGVLLTGALHLDALADTADALGAGSRTRALEVMRDHAVGAFGAAAIGLDLLLRTTALAVLSDRGEVVRFAVAAGALSRLTPVVVAAALPYARSADGAGAALARAPWGRALAGAGLAAAIGLGVAGLDGLVLFGVVAAIAVGAAAALGRWLGGVTGDALGATSELSEVVLLVVGVALVGAR